jgi:hypothetical protein
MHFASSKGRQGAKSLKEISSLFSGEVDDDDDDGGEEVGSGPYNGASRSGSGSASKAPLN